MSASNEIKLKISIDGNEAVGSLELPEQHRKRMKSTNLVERLNQELKRRSRVVRIFPNTESVQRLLGTICINISDQWLTNGIYLNFNKENTEN